MKLNRWGKFTTFKCDDDEPKYVRFVKYLHWLNFPEAEPPFVVAHHALAHFPAKGAPFWGKFAHDVSQGTEDYESACRAFEASTYIGQELNVNSAGNRYSEDLDWLKEDHTQCADIIRFYVKQVKQQIKHRAAQLEHESPVKFASAHDKLSEIESTFGLYERSTAKLDDYEANLTRLNELATLEAKLTLLGLEMQNISARLDGHALVNDASHEFSPIGVDLDTDEDHARKVVRFVKYFRYGRTEDTQLDFPEDMSRPKRLQRQGDPNWRLLQTKMTNGAANYHLTIDYALLPSDEIMADGREEYEIGLGSLEFDIKQRKRVLEAYNSQVNKLIKHLRRELPAQGKEGGELQVELDNVAAAVPKTFPNGRWFNDVRHIDKLARLEAELTLIQLKWDSVCARRPGFFHKPAPASTSAPASSSSSTRERFRRAIKSAKDSLKSPPTNPGLEAYERMTENQFSVGAARMTPRRARMYQINV